MPGDVELVDVIVVGAGGAGLAAAVAAAAASLRVLVLEKLDGPFGTTSLSVGSMAAAGTRLQRIAGIADHPNDFAEDIARAYPPAREFAELRELLAREAGPTLTWLEQLGVVFVGPFPEPPNRVPRMHNAVPQGRSYLEVLVRSARAAGVTLRFGCRVERLTLENGTVTGLVSRHHDGTETALGARLGIVLATGDFSGSEPMRRAHLPQPTHNAIPINPNSTGDGQRMGDEIGAGLAGMGEIFGPQLRFEPPLIHGVSILDVLPGWQWLRSLIGWSMTRLPTVLLGPLVRGLLIAHMSPSDRMFAQGAVLVNAAGERLALAPNLAAQVAATTDRQAFIAGNRGLAQRFGRYPNFVSTAPGIAFAYFHHYEQARPDLVTWGNSISQLAEQRGMRATALAEALAGQSPPYFLLGPVRPMMTVTEGGLAIDTSCRVLNRSGVPIPGLLAAGGVAQGGLCLKGHGLHLAWALTTGRLAGEAVASCAGEQEGSGTGLKGSGSTV